MMRLRSSVRCSKKVIEPPVSSCAGAGVAWGAVSSGSPEVMGGVMREVGGSCILGRLRQSGCFRVRRAWAGFGGGRRIVGGVRDGFRDRGDDGRFGHAGIGGR